MTRAQSWDPEQYARHARFVSELGAPLLQWLEPRAGERILDLGCGDGVLTRQLADLGCRVIGVDSSPEQVQAAQRLGLDARVADGEQLPFSAELDAVFSNAALHWMKAPDAVLAGVARGLVPGGRFVGELGGEGCVATIRDALAQALARRGIDAAAFDPWYFPSVADYSVRLAAAGFVVDEITLFPRPTPLPTDVAGWLQTFAQSFLSAVPQEQRPELLAEVCADLRPSLCPDGQHWTADYVRLRFRASKPA